jgi:hypothetical protein
MTIAFIHNNKSFLPEVGAYVEYFSARGIICEVVLSEKLNLLKPDVAWYFMGTHLRKLQGALTIHEYTSSSVAPYASLKNKLKKWANAKPDYRIFLNEYIRSAIGFNDEVPYGFRDMGVSETWLRPATVNKKRQGFVYLGELQNRDITKLLYWFSEGSMRAYPLLVVSKDYSWLQSKYKSYGISFTGPVTHAQVREILLNASFGINFIPDKEPFNSQTSTKLLEYAACGNKIITTDYKWVREFQRQYGGNFLFLKDDFSNFDADVVHQFEYASPDLRDWTWQKQIERSGIVKFLAAKFPELNLQSS